MNKKVYQWILKIGVFLSFVTIFLLFNKLFFPYVTSKQLSFNILIEVLTVFWLVYIIKYKEERPKLRMLSWSLIAFFAVILLSSLISIDPHLSFWGKTERMLGFVHAVHFLAFYFIIITAFKRLVDFKYLLSALILSALAIAMSMLESGDVRAVIGNQAYTVGFFLFAIYLSVYLFFKTKNNWRYLFLVPVIITLVAFLMANITGAVLGLGVSVLVALILVALLYKRLWYRIGAGILALVMISTVAVVLVYPNQAWIKNNRVLSEISLETNTLQTRFIAWKAALINYKEYPVLGTGYNTFSYTFDKHFDADFYNHSMSETYFDRAHNNLLDIASSMGSVGLLSYLMIMVSALIYFIKILVFSKRKESLAKEEEQLETKTNEEMALNMSSKKRKKLEKKLRRKETNKSSILSSYINFSSSNHLLALIALFSLLVAYFVQNLAVFDTYITYLALMVFLAFIRFLYMDIKAKSSVSGAKEINGEKEKGRKMPAVLEYALLAMLVIIFGTLMYKLNISTFRAHSQAIEGYSQVYRSEVEEGLDTFVKALDSETPFQRDPRSSLIKLVLGDSQILNDLNNEEKIEYYNRLLVLNSYNLKNSNGQNIYLVQESQIFNKMAELYKKTEDEDKTILYKEKALQYINGAIKASPERIKQYWMKGQILIDLGEEEAGLKQWQEAIALNENYSESYCQYAQAYLILGQKDEAYKQMDKCISSGGVDLYAQKAVLMRAVKHYQGTGDYENMLVIYNRYAELVHSADVWQSLAEMYTNKEKWREAKECSLKALDLVDDDKKKNSIQVFLDIVERKLSE